MYSKIRDRSECHKNESARERERERRDETSAVEFDMRVQPDNGGGITDGEGMVKRLESLLVVVDVGLMVLQVVELHHLRRDYRLQSRVIVRQFRDRERLQPTNKAMPPKPYALGCSPRS